MLFFLYKRSAFPMGAAKTLAHNSWCGLARNPQDLKEREKEKAKPAALPAYCCVLLLLPLLLL